MRPLLVTVGTTRPQLHLATYSQHWGRTTKHTQQHIKEKQIFIVIV